MKSYAISTIFGKNLATSTTRQNTMTEAAETDVFENIQMKWKKKWKSMKILPKKKKTMY